MSTASYLLFVDDSDHCYAFETREDRIAAVAAVTHAALCYEPEWHQHDDEWWVYTV